MFEGAAYNRDMPKFDLTAIDPAELVPLPDAPASYGSRDAEDEHVHALVVEGLTSGPAEPLDDAFFAELDEIISHG